MRSVRVPWTAFGLLLSFAMRGSAQSSAGPISRAASVEAAVRFFGTALAHGDDNSLRALAAPEFALVEDGRTYDVNGAIASARQALAAGALTRAEEDFHTTVRGDVAWTRFRTRGRFTAGAQSTDFVRMESAVAEWTTTGWRIARMTSMPAAEPAPPGPR